MSIETLSSDIGQEVTPDLVARLRSVVEVADDTKARRICHTLFGNLSLMGRALGVGQGAAELGIDDVTAARLIVLGRKVGGVSVTEYPEAQPGKDFRDAIFSLGVPVAIRFGRGDEAQAAPELIRELNTTLLDAYEGLANSADARSKTTIERPLLRAELQDLCELGNHYQY